MYWVKGLVVEFIGPVVVKQRFHVFLQNPMDLAFQVLLVRLFVNMIHEAVGTLARPNGSVIADGNLSALMIGKKNGPPTVGSVVTRATTPLGLILHEAAKSKKERVTIPEVFYHLQKLRAVRGNDSVIGGVVLNLLHGFGFSTLKPGFKIFGEFVYSTRKPLIMIHSLYILMEIITLCLDRERKN